MRLYINIRNSHNSGLFRQNTLVEPAVFYHIFAIVESFLEKSMNPRLTLTEGDLARG